MAALRSAILAQREPASLAAAAGARIDLLPHQLEPALAVLRHGARRLLLADAVGLGKTIEAGLVLAELRARSALDRVLILAPPGLCDQWCAELAGRFGLDAAVADAAWLRGLRAVLPAAVNPWSIPGIRVASFDFAKRPEVRRSIEHVLWDAVVVDEAHLAAGESERRAAAHALAARARFVLLLTATPHSGDPSTFHALCGLGALAANDPIFLFRRNREEAGISRRRRVHLHHVGSPAAELEIRRLLDDYIRMVWTRRTGPEGRDARLAMIVLLKRSFSGMGPLHLSLLTRLDRLGLAPAAETAQLSLSWEADLEQADAAPSGVLGASGLDDPSHERRILRDLADRTGFFTAGDSKRRALMRILERLREPAILFTEYRDTLTALHHALGADAAVIHGAMDRFERAAAVDRFNRGAVRLLLATDAAGEGLNLQQRCRLVVNLELPWNPMRLEQRIGRVDRIGQTRTVHAINLLASGTAESDLLARLARRLDCAQSTIGPIDDVLGGREEKVLAACLGLAGSTGGRTAAARSTRGEAAPQRMLRVDLRAAARDATEQLARQRQLIQASQRRTRTMKGESVTLRSAGVLAAATQRSRFPLTRGRSGLLVVFRIHSRPFAGTAPADRLVPVFAECPCARISRRQHLRARASLALTTIVPAMAAVIPQREASAAPASVPFDRDTRLAARAGARRAIQRGLFDRRSEREAEESEADAPPADGPLFNGGMPDSPARRPPQPVLLLFVTS
jgi:superfamily II DNA/RNA helicase